MTTVGRFLDFPLAQYVGIAVAVALGVALHWSNDGLWYQGDAPRHAATGLFYWDLITQAPTRPVEYAARYYARYPVIVPGVYPPLFHLVEGVLFRVMGPSPYVAKGLVWAFAALGGVYALFWGRQFIAPWAGWAGALILLLPGFVLYSNVVLLNVPATALELAALYHLQRWFGSGALLHQRLFLGFTVAAVAVYIPSGIVLPIAFVWAIARARGLRGWSMWLPVAFMVSLVLLTAGMMPGHMARQAPSVMRAFTLSPWTFYAHGLPSILGNVWPWFGTAGIVVAVSRPATRFHALRLLTAAAVLVAILACLPARDPRYVLPLGPLCVFAACLGVAALTTFDTRWRYTIAAGALTLMLGVAVFDAVRTRVPNISGVKDVAQYLVAHGPADAALYSGVYDGVFSFYVRALDPRFERRVVLSNKLLYRFQLGPDFIWTETRLAQSEDDVVAFIKSRCGCPWVAVESLPEWNLPVSEQMLRRALSGTAFDHVASFPVVMGPVRSIELYHLRQPVERVPSVNLSFPSFSDRVFDGVAPVERR